MQTINKHIRLKTKNCTPQYIVFSSFNKIITNLLWINLLLCVIILLVTMKRGGYL